MSLCWSCRLYVFVLVCFPVCLSVYLSGLPLLTHLPSPRFPNLSVLSGNNPVQDPGAGFEDLLPCPHNVVTLNDNYMPDVVGEILNAEVSAALGLPPFSPIAEGHAQEEGGGPGRTRRRLRARSLGGEEKEHAVLSLETSVGDGGGSAGGAGGEGGAGGAAVVRSGGGAGGKGRFDLSVLCTAVSDLNHLMKPTYPVDQRLVDALLWNVDVRELCTSIFFLSAVAGHERGRLLPLRSALFFVSVAHVTRKCFWAVRKGGHTLYVVPRRISVVYPMVPCLVYVYVRHTSGRKVLILVLFLLSRNVPPLPPPTLSGGDSPCVCLFFEGARPLSPSSPRSLMNSFSHM